MLPLVFFNAIAPFILRRHPPLKEMPQTAIGTLVIFVIQKYIPN